MKRKKNSWFDDTDWERSAQEYYEPYIVFIPENMNTINIKYKDLHKLKIQDIDKDALYMIKTDFSEYTDVKTGNDLIRIIKGVEKITKR